MAWRDLTDRERRLVYRAWISITLLILLGSFWLFGRTYPIGFTDQQQTQSTICSACSGSGLIACPDCAGFGFKEKKEACSACGGTGKHAWNFKQKNESSAPCQECRGSGTQTTRIKCDTCKESGKRPCPGCKGNRTITRTTDARRLSFGHSTWERTLARIGVDPDPNPCPQGNPVDGYPLIREYLSLRFKDRPAELVAWGPFEQKGGIWISRCRVKVKDPAGNLVERMVLFQVENRVLIDASVARTAL